MLPGEDLIVLDECFGCAEEEEHGDPEKNFSRELSTSSEDSVTSPDKVHRCYNFSILNIYKCSLQMQI